MRAIAEPDQVASCARQFEAHAKADSCHDALQLLQPECGGTAILQIRDALTTEPASSCQVCLTQAEPNASRADRPRDEVRIDHEGMPAMSPA
jgi:hypothetical protein